MRVHKKYPNIGKPSDFAFNMLSKYPDFINNAK